MKQQAYLYSAVFLLLMTPQLALAEGKEKPDSYKFQNMKYDVYAGGVNVVTSQYRWIFVQPRVTACFLVRRRKVFSKCWRRGSGRLNPRDGF